MAELGAVVASFSEEGRIFWRERSPLSSSEEKPAAGHFPIVVKTAGGVRRSCNSMDSREVVLGNDVTTAFGNGW